MRTIKGIKVTDSQGAVYDVLRARGPMPDHALVPLAQHSASVHQSSSGIRTRRAELSRLGLVRATGNRVKMPSGRYADEYKAVA